MDLDTELIKEVKTQPVLYDPNNPMYKDNDFKQKIWLEIGEKVLETKDKTTAVSALKARWKSLRDAYVKERKYDLAQTNGINVRPKKPWRFKTQMEFLAPFIQTRKEFSIAAETKPVQQVKSGDAKITDLSATNNTLKMVDENGSYSNFETNLFNQYIPKSEDPRFIEIDSFFRDIANAVKGLNRNSQLSLEKEIIDLVMNYKLKELEDDEQEQNV